MLLQQLEEQPRAEEAVHKLLTLPRQQCEVGASAPAESSITRPAVTNGFFFFFFVTKENILSSAIFRLLCVFSRTPPISIF